GDWSVTGVQTCALPILLPSLSGIEVCRQIRRSPEHRRTPIIMLSARGEESEKLRGLEVGADDYVTKPFSPSELMARCHAVMRRGGREKGVGGEREGERG